MTYNTSEWMEIAAGRKKSRLVLKNARIVNVFTHEVYGGDIAVAGDRIAGIGHYEGLEEIDLEGGMPFPDDGCAYASGVLNGHAFGICPGGGAERYDHSHRRPA